MSPAFAARPASCGGHGGQLRSLRPKHKMTMPEKEDTTVDKRPEGGAGGSVQAAIESIVHERLSLPETSRREEDPCFRSVVCEPPAAISAAYQPLVWSWPAETQGAVLSWEASHSADRFGQSHDDMARYGVGPAQIDSAFSDYRQRFGAFV